MANVIRGACGAFSPSMPVASTNHVLKKFLFRQSTTRCNQSAERGAA
jgi:hypothetical protein